MLYNGETACQTYVDMIIYLIKSNGTKNQSKSEGINEENIDKI